MTSNFELSLQVDAAVPDYLTGDPMRLQQVLTNPPATPSFTERGNVDVRVEQTGESNGNKVRLQVLIRDTGIGISEEQQRQLFQAFNQADSPSPAAMGAPGSASSSPRSWCSRWGQIRFESELGKGAPSSPSNLSWEVSPAPDRAAAAGSHPGQAGLAAGA